MLVNGFELYPNADPLRGELWAGQVLEDEASEKIGHVKNVKEWVESMEQEEDSDRDSDHDHEDNKKQHKNRKYHKNRKHRKHRKTLPQNLGFGLRTSSSPQTSSDPADLATAAADQEIIDLNLQILEVGTAFVSGIPSVEIKLLRDVKTQKLMIGNIETAASNEDSGVPVPFMGVVPDQDQKEEEKCDNFLCRLLEGFRDKVKEGKKAWGKKMGGCHGGGHGMGVGMGQSVPVVEVEEGDDERVMPVVEIDIERIDFKESEDGTWEIVASPVEVEEQQAEEEEEKKIKDLLEDVPEQEDAEGHHGWRHGHHHGGMHRYEHSWGQLLKSITAHVLLPVLIGIVAGVSVSLYVFSLLFFPFLPHLPYLNNR